MEFMTHRPSLPIGFQIGSISPVQRALHADQSREIYLLEHSADSDLLLIRAPAESMLRQSEWWGLLGPDLVKEASEDLPQDGRTCVIRIHGSWWPTNVRLIDRSHWRPLVLGSLKMLQTAFKANLRPILCPSLIWISQETQVCIPVCAVPVEAASETTTLRELAAVLLSGSTGIDMDALAANVDQLESWNKGIPSDVLNALIALLSDKASESVSGFEEFENRLAGKPPVRGDASVEIPVGAGHDGLNKIAGMGALKELLRKEVVGPLRRPEIYEKYRIGVPNGILFYGPPGCGKTYMARQLAEELGYFFQDIRPSDIASPFIHSTVTRIRELFDIALEKAPSVLFIDEFDAFVPSRSELSGHQQYKSEEVNEFLANLEGCAARKVLVIAATNAPEKIDPAVRRAGRLDKLVFIPPPDAEARVAMLQFHLQDRPVEPSLDCRGVGVILDGYSASDIRLLVEEAARAACEKAASISTLLLLDAIHRVPPSITPEDEARFRQFQSRGTS